MKISIITVFPELYEAFIGHSIIARAVEQKIISFDLIRLSDVCAPKERIDEPACGHGVGMILKPEVIERAIELCENRSGKGFKIFFSPQGKVLTQNKLKLLAQQFLHNAPDQGQETVTSSQGKHIILVCGRYEGIDTRVERYYADLLLSIGDYVLMGGDIPAQVFLEGFLRLIPGVVGKQESVEKESFEAGFLDHPAYGLPVEWKGFSIPDVVRSGNHKALAQWRQSAAAEKTIKTRFDWFSQSNPTAECIELARTFVPPHYVAIMHTQVVLKGGAIGNTSIPSVDIHDIARSCATYGIKNFFIVSPLEDQQSIVKTFLDFWNSEDGKKYNANRQNAISRVIQAYSYDEMIESITNKEGVAPIIVTTSAKEHGLTKKIDYFSQQEVWQTGKPVLMLFGTGQGLCNEILDKSDYLLVPISGMTNYKHLSVRSAASIILDRWLGLNPKLT